MTNKYKLALTACLVLLAQTSSAYCRPGCGAYLGLQAGGCNLHYEHSQLAIDSISVEDSGFSGRLIAGIDLNPNVGLELGLTLYHDPEFKYHGDTTTSFSQTSLDFLGKLTLPVACNMNIFAEGGLSYVHRGHAEVRDDNVTVTVNDDDYHLRPMLGAGIGYAFTPRISGNVVYLRTFGAEDLPDADFYGVGLTFRVG